MAIAHAAASLPFRRTKLIASAVVIGCFAPDFEYFIRLAPKGGFGHTFPGLFALDLPLGLAVYWLFHRYVREPLWAWLPDGIRQRVKLNPRMGPLRGIARSALVSLSILVGAVTHILWDSLTHPASWPYRHWHFLSDTVQVPHCGVGAELQVAPACEHDLRHFRPSDVVYAPAEYFSDGPPLSGNGRINERLVFIFASAIALAAGTLRALVGAGAPIGLHRIQIFIGEAVVTTISVFWLELVIYGFLRERIPGRPEGFDAQ